jgi:predicted enzyme related to lactoylglutathione lyase
MPAKSVRDEGVPIMGDVVNYFEIGTADVEATTAFYRSLFDWHIGESGGYRAVEGDKGGVWDTATTGGGSWAIFYVQVDDVQATIGEAAELGATVVVPFTDNGRIEFAHLQDPQGNRFGVWRPNG